MKFSLSQLFRQKAQGRTATAPARRRVALYDITDQSNPAGGRKRRPARIETTTEEGILRPVDRLHGINLSRDMLRNNPQYRGFAKTLRANIVGDCGKLRFQSTDPWYIEAQRWFNDEWAHHADFFDGSTWREALQLAIVAIVSEGDFGVVFDNGLLTGGNGTGKLRFFEADCICNLDDADFAPWAERGYRQDSGIVFNPYGQISGFIATGQPGRGTVRLADGAFVLIFDPNDPNDPDFKLVRRKFRQIQARGAADSLASLQTVLDTYEMLALELQTGKVAASRYCAVEEAADSVDDSLGRDGFADDDDGEGAPDGSEGGGDEEEDSCDALERYTGGNVDYVPNGTKIQFDPANRPNANLPGFLDYTLDVAGAAFGLSHSYARNRADTSYTAYRGDMVMSYLCFRDFQQFIEDAFADWVASKAIGYAIATGALPPAPDGWKRKIAWQWPTMPSVDEQKEQAAIAQKFKNGLTTFRDQLGPSWRETLDQLAEELDYAKAKGIPLSAFETAAGAAAVNPTKEQ